MSAETCCSMCGELRPCKPWGGKPWCVECFPAAVGGETAKTRIFAFHGSSVAAAGRGGA